MTALAGILTQGLHIALVVAIAPLLLGAIRWLKARMLGRAAPIRCSRCATCGSCCRSAR